MGGVPWPPSSQVCKESLMGEGENAKSHALYKDSPTPTGPSTVSK